MHIRAVAHLLSGLHHVRATASGTGKIAAVLDAVSDGLTAEEREAGLDQVRYTAIGSVIGTHAGPGAVGVAFFKKH